MKQPAEKDRTISEPVEQNRPILIVQVVWGCYAFNASPKGAAERVVSDLFNLLARGGTVPVHIEDSDGNEHTLEVGARWP